MPRLKVGLASNLVHTTLGPTALVRANHMLAAANRLDSLWLPDHLNALLPRAIATPKYLGAAVLTPRIDACLDPWMALGHIAARNRLTNLRLGIGVTDASRRNPAITAQAAATLHLMTRGKAILGIGAGEREGNEPYGVDWTKPVGRFEEAVATIRALWDSKGQLVNRDSPFFPLRNALFSIPSHKGKWPEIWIAAHGPRMLRIAGHYADAWFPCFPQRPIDYADRLRTIRIAASDSGRDPMRIIPAVWLFVVTGSTPAAVSEVMDSDIAKSFALLISADMWQRHGANHPLGEGFTGFQDIMPQTMDEHSVLTYTAQVPASLMNEAILAGTPDEVIDQVAVWRDHGARYIVICDMSTMGPSLLHGLRATAPLGRVLRGVKRLQWSLE